MVILLIFWTHLEPTLLPLSLVALSCPFSSVPTVELLYMVFLGQLMPFTFLTLCHSAASVGQCGVTLWITFSGRTFLTPTSGLNPPSLCSDSILYFRALTSPYSTINLYIVPSDLETNHVHYQLSSTWYGAWQTEP